MKAIRYLLAIAFASLFASTVVLAEHHDEKKAESKAACGCVTGADGKACGVDKDCCCSGEKAKGASAEKKEEKKAEHKAEKKAE